MSFMFNPHPYDDWSAINKPQLTSDVINSIISGTNESAKEISRIILNKLESGKDNIILAIDGYIGVQFKQLVNLISQEMKLKSVDIKTFDFKEVIKSSEK